MKKLLLSLGLTLGVALSCTPTLAVKPAPIDQGAGVKWSEVIDDPFDGKVVYDKNFDNSFAFVSAWSLQGIRATYTQYWQERVGYRTVWREHTIYRDGKKKTVSYPEQEPVYKTYSRNTIPETILFSIRGQIYTYKDGEVSPELATALASAPAGNMRIRLVLGDSSTKDMEIGKGTVAAWKTIFSPTAIKQSSSLNAFVVVLNQQGQVLVNNAMMSDDQLTQRLQSYLAENPQAKAVLKADKLATYERVSQVLEMMRKIGGDRISVSME